MLASPTLSRIGATSCVSTAQRHAAGAQARCRACCWSPAPSMCLVLVGVCGPHGEAPDQCADAFQDSTADAGGLLGGSLRGLPRRHGLEERRQPGDLEKAFFHGPLDLLAFAY